jgi:ADP-L-glycero-D-manno-heptose 6-epimerase
MKLFETQTLRDFIHVDDVVDVMLWMWRTRPPSGIYDIGTGECFSISRLHSLIAGAMAKPTDFEEIDMPASLAGRYQFHTCADTRRLRAAGYDRPFTTLPEGIARMLTCRA